MNLLIVFYSLYGHIYEMTKEAARGAGEVNGVDTKIMRVPETLPDNILEKMGALKFQQSLKDIPVIIPDDLAKADAVIFGTPTRFGNMCGQMRQFLDFTGQLWAKGSLVGKVGSVFTSTSTQHGGQESTILSFHTTLLHHGMIIVGLPYTFSDQMKIDEMSGCSPYGASTITGGDGSRMPSKTELAGAHFQGKHVAQIAMKLSR